MIQFSSSVPLDRIVIATGSKRTFFLDPINDREEEVASLGNSWRSLYWNIRSFVK
jgi:hypothetical protein